MTGAEALTWAGGTEDGMGITVDIAGIAREIGVSDNW